MLLGSMKSSVSTKQLEEWLTQVLVPVEPSEVFIRQLKTRLLKIRGHQVFSIWMLIGVMAMIMVFMLTWLGSLLRIFFLITGMFVSRRQRNPKGRKFSVASG
jgi:hypothetical protein